MIGNKGLTKGVLILFFYVLIVNIIVTIILFINCNRSLNEIKRINQSVVQEIKSFNSHSQLEYNGD